VLYPHIHFSTLSSLVLSGCAILYFLIIQQD
jgi:hypothetical protein